MADEHRVRARIRELGHTDFAGVGSGILGVSVLGRDGHLGVVDEQVNGLRQLHYGRSQNHHHIPKALGAQFSLEGFDEVVTFFEGGVHFPVSGENFHGRGISGAKVVVWRGWQGWRGWLLAASAEGARAVSSYWFLV